MTYDVYLGSALPRVALAAGSYYSMAGVSNGTGKASAWGYNNYGMLGDGTTSNRYLAVSVSNLTGVVGLAGGVSHSLAVKSDGTVWGWGRNNYGQVGDRSTTTRTKPVPASNIVNAVMVEAGYYHSLALRSNGTAWAWGYNGYGQLGFGNTKNTNMPCVVSNLVNVADIAGGMYHSLAAKSDGTAWAWGRNNYGQLGDRSLSNRYVAVLVSNLTGVVDVDAGYYHSLAVKSNGTVWGWGYNGYGQLGFGNTKNTNMPCQVSNLVDVVAIACGEHHSMAVKADGSVWAWGRNNYGQLGDGTLTTRTRPSRVSNVVATVVAGQMTLVSDNQAGTTYDPGTLKTGTRYSWQILATDNHGASTTGTVWSFRTTPVVMTPSYTPNGGTYTNSRSVVLLSLTPGARIYYATNGTGPTTNSPWVNTGGSITLYASFSNTVRAFATATGYVNSAISTSALFVVKSGNTAPVASNQTVTTAEDTSKAITLTGGDAETTNLTYSIASNPTKGTLSGTAPNVTYRPNTNWYGSDSFTFRVSDGSLTSGPATVSITITPVADDLYVDQSNVSGTEYGTPAYPFNTIQEAVAVASPGDSVLVTNGTYVLSSTIIVTNPVAVRSINGPDVTIVDGNNAVRCFLLENDAATVDGFTVTKGYANYGAGFYVGHISIPERGGLVENCIVVSNTAYQGAGGAYIYGDGAILRNCLFAYNNAFSGGGGVFGGMEPQVENCTIVRNYSYNYGGGLYNAGGSHIKNTIVWYNTSVLDDPNFFNNGYNGTFDHSCLPTNIPGDGNITNEPLFADMDAGDFRLMFGSPCVDTGNSTGAPPYDLDGQVRPIDGDGDGAADVDIGAYELPRSVFVDDSNTNVVKNGTLAYPYNTIYEGVAATTNAGETVRVAAGNYDGYLGIYSRSYLTLVGEGESNTVVSGYFDIAGCNGVTVDGFDFNGGVYGFYVSSSANIVLRGNVIRNMSQGQYNWGGASISASSSSILLENNLFQNNYGGQQAGAGIYSDCSLDIRGNDIIGCTAWNSAGGMYITAGTAGRTLNIQDNFFSGDQADYSGALVISWAVPSGVAVIQNNVFHNSNADYKGVTVSLSVSESSSAYILNNIVKDPWSPNYWYPTGFACSGAGPVYAANNIFYCTLPYANIAVSGGTNVLVEYNDSVGMSYSGVTVGAGNISTNPLFVDPSVHDYYLQTNSPCINAGNPNSYYNDADGSRNDMGVYGGPGAGE
ncbi:MAG: hypothetical protein BWK77_08460 [Verrucomicrobia bacterium A1]|nr:MAG: hypothetical protein BWK77_08460 [Verrucomicrobia bacterium A1]